MADEYEQFTAVQEEEEEGHREFNGLRGEKFTITNDGESFSEQVFGDNGALQRAIDASPQEEQAALSSIRTSLILQCRKTLTLDEHHDSKTILHCHSPDATPSRRQDFVMVQFNAGVTTVAYPARIEAIFSVPFPDGPRAYVIIRTMLEPRSPLASAVMQFEKTEFDSTGLWAVSARTITKRVCVLPNVDVDDEYYIYPDVFPDVLG